MTDRQTSHTHYMHTHTQHTETQITFCKQKSGDVQHGAYLRVPG